MKQSEVSQLREIYEKEATNQRTIKTDRVRLKLRFTLTLSSS